MVGPLSNICRPVQSRPDHFETQSHPVHAEDYIKLCFFKIRIRYIRRFRFSSCFDSGVSFASFSTRAQAFSYCVDGSMTNLLFDVIRVTSYMPRTGQVYASTWRECKFAFLSAGGAATAAAMMKLLKP
jgi:hypothetical protein